MEKLDCTPLFDYLGAVGGMIAGTKLRGRWDEKFLQRVFSVAMIIMAVVMLVN